MQQHSRIKARSYSALFLIVILIHIAVDLFVSILENKYSIPLVIKLIISEMTIMIPGLIWLLLYNVPIKAGLGFRKIKISTVLMTILLSYLIMPLATLMNLISQLFTTNEVASISMDVMSGNGLVMLLIIGFFGPFCEEFVFRGIIAKGLSGYTSIAASALVSGLFFGLMHMNLNQFCYAFVLGIIFAVINYASGSLYTSIIMHVVVNSHNVVLLLLMEAFYKYTGIDMGKMDMLAETKQVYESGILYYAIGLFIIIAIIFLMAAIPVFAFIARNEGNPSAYSNLLNKENKLSAGKSWWLNPYSVIATAICVVVIFFLEKILILMGF